MARHNSTKKLLSQKEVANLFGVAQNTIKNWRERNLLNYFRAPGSSRVLYFEDDVNDFIQKNTKIKKGGHTQQQYKAEKNHGKPCVSSDEDWRIS